MSAATTLGCLADNIETNLTGCSSKLGRLVICVPLGEGTFGIYSCTILALLAKRA